MALELDAAARTLNAAPPTLDAARRVSAQLKSVTEELSAAIPTGRGSGLRRLSAGRRATAEPAGACAEGDRRARQDRQQRRQPPARLARGRRNRRRGRRSRGAGAGVAGLRDQPRRSRRRRVVAGRRVAPPRFRAGPAGQRTAAPRALDDAATGCVARRAVAHRRVAARSGCRAGDGGLAAAECRSRDRRADADVERARVVRGRFRTHESVRPDRRGPRRDRGGHRDGPSACWLQSAMRPRWPALPTSSTWMGGVAARPDGRSSTNPGRLESFFSLGELLALGGAGRDIDLDPWGTSALVSTGCVCTRMPSPGRFAAGRRAGGKSDCWRAPCRT